MIDKRNQTVKSFFTECHGLMIFFSRRYYQQVTIDRPDLVEYPKKSKHFQNSILNLQGYKMSLFKEKRKKGKEKKNESNEKRSVIDFVDSDKYIEH